MKELASILAVSISFITVVPYIIGTVRGKIKPHAFTWLIWGLTTLIAFAGQIAGHGGMGAAATGSSGLICAGIGVYALWKGEHDFKPLDWLSLAGALLAIVSWSFTHSPLSAIILISIVDVIGCIPTVRKAYWKPEEEGVSPFAISTIKWLFAIYAFKQINLTTLLFPIVTSGVNAIIIVTVVLRRRKKEHLVAKDLDHKEAS